MIVDLQEIHVQKPHETGIQISTQSMVFAWFVDVLTCPEHVQDQDYFP